MKHGLLALFALVLCVGLAMSGAEAAMRLGGGKSFGLQRAIPLRQYAAPHVPSSAPTLPATSSRSRWLGPLAGMATGLGLAALFSHFGLGAGSSSFMMMLLLVGVGFYLVRRLLAGRLQPQIASPGYAGAPPPYGAQSAGAATAPTVPLTAGPIDGPPGFDSVRFVRQAKTIFLRLQAANDTGDSADIGKFTTPEMYAEIKLQLQERSIALQRTDVVQLEAELVELSSEANQTIASVRFFGTLREANDGAPEAFNEIWHVTKPTDGSREWTIAGIQQVA